MSDAQRNTMATQVSGDVTHEEESNLWSLEGGCGMQSNKPHEYTGRTARRAVIMRQSEDDAQGRSHEEDMFHAGFLMSVCHEERQKGVVHMKRAGTKIQGDAGHVASRTRVVGAE